MKIKRLLKQFSEHPSASGILLIVSGCLAMFASNSSLSPYYDALLHVPVAVQVGQFHIHKPLLLWINDGLMALFFLLVGLEVKRELLIGRLASFQKALLPCIAATGGVICPALIFYYFNHENDLALAGWAIPTATDIAFALGILSLMGNRVSQSITLLLMTIAILDDLLAIFIIAVFYSYELSVLSLTLAGFAILLLMFMNVVIKVRHIGPYIVVGIFLWIFVLKSGVHATLAGVVLAFAIPLREYEHDRRGSPVKRLTLILYPWVSFAVMPIFAFANAGVYLGDITLHDILHPVPMGIALGLFIGKQVGVFSISWLAVKTRIAHLPEGATWGELYGMAILCGIGFTMSLFIGSLAYPHGVSPFALTDRLGILLGSFASAVLGIMVLKFLPAKEGAQPIPAHH